jgi:hypothetical protein
MDHEPKTSSPTPAVRVTMAVALLALIGGLGAAIIAKYYRPAHLELVDVNITEKPQVSTHGGFVMSRYGLSDLELLLKNNGDRVAVASAVELEVKDLWRLVRQSPLDFYLAPSHEYSVVIDPAREAPYTLTVPITQALKGDEADHISVSIGLNPMKPFENIYHISVRVRYNSTLTTEKRDVVLVLPDLTDSNPPYFFSEYDREVKISEAVRKRNAEYRRKMNVKKKGIDVLAMIRHDKEAQEIDRSNRGVINRADQIGGKRNARASALIAKASGAVVTK